MSDRPRLGTMPFVAYVEYQIAFLNKEIENFYMDDADGGVTSGIKNKAQVDSALAIIDLMREVLNPDELPSV